MRCGRLFGRLSRWSASFRFSDHDAPMAIGFVDRYELVMDFFDPGGNVRGRALVGRPDLDLVADRCMPERADQFHQWPRTKGAARVDHLSFSHRRCRPYKVTSWPASASDRNFVNPSGPSNSFST